MLLPLKIVQNFLQKIRITLGKQLLDKSVAPLTDNPLALYPVRKILFLRKDSKIGDTIVSSFVFREIIIVMLHLYQRNNSITKCTY